MCVMWICSSSFHEYAIRDVLFYFYFFFGRPENGDQHYELPLCEDVVELGLETKKAFPIS